MKYLYKFSKLCELWPTNGLDFRVLFKPCSGSFRIFCNSHEGRPKELDHSLPRIRQWAVFEIESEKFQSFLSLKRVAKNCL